MANIHMDVTNAYGYNNVLRRYASLIVTAGTFATALVVLGIVINIAALPISMASLAMCFQTDTI